MNIVKVAAASLNQTPLDWHGNVARIEAVIAEARAKGAALLCLPELCSTGYGCEDAFFSADVLKLAFEGVIAISKSAVGIAVCVGLPLLVDGSVYNCVAVIADGRIIGFVAKQNLAGDGIHYEPRWFKPWKAGTVSEVEWQGERFPVGDLIFDFKGIRVGFEICEDAWVTARPAFRLAQRGVDIILNPSASHFAFGKCLVREKLVLDGAAISGGVYVYANLLGCEAGRAIYDGDTLIASGAQIVQRGIRFSYHDSSLIVCDVDVARNRESRKHGVEAVKDPNSDIILVHFNLTKESEKQDPEQPNSAWENASHRKCEEFWRAVSLGLFDYLRKSRSSGFVVSLSGGVDSTAVSCLVALMVREATKQLGISGLTSKLGYISWMQSVTDESSLLRELLCCVYQGTNNSSEVTRNAAFGVATHLGATFYELNMSDLVTGYERLISEATGIDISWEKYDIAKQNIQARVRSPSVWLLANLRGALLLSTGNRSEASVGYTTMDGDSSGGLSPLGGIDKAFLREWLVWLERIGPLGMNAAMPVLSLVNQQAPTAELRPLDRGQTDEGDLMPYVVLDKIERYAVRDKKSPQEVLALVHVECGERYSREDLLHWTERFFTLWSQNQWKRERLAPSFHLDDESVDPKTWCRFPILSGGYRYEIQRMRERA